MPPRATNLYQNLWRQKFSTIISIFYQLVKKVKELSGFFFQTHLTTLLVTHKSIRAYGVITIMSHRVKNRVVAGQNDKHTDF